MLRAPQQHPGHKQRGRGCCATSERPTPSLFVLSSLFRMLSPTIPAHRSHSPVSPIIPALMQKQGGGGCYRNSNVPKICRRADNFRADRLRRRSLHKKGERREANRTVPSRLTFEVHSGCRSEGTPHSLHILIMTNATCARRRRVRCFPWEIQS